MRRGALWFLTLAIAASPLGARAARAILPSEQAKAADKLPPVSWTCPMDPEIVEDKAGKCPKCGMALEAIRLDTVWTCPIHAAVQKDRAGKCPIDGRDLVQMTMAVTWVCAGQEPKDGSIEPGTCSDGSAKQRRFTARPHGNHNPQHGGQFFMAPDNWHHLEGAYFAPGTFRLYLYDDYTKPLTLAQVRATKARVILTKDGKEFPLVRNGRFFEAKIGKVPFPAAMQARLKFQPEAPEHLFDFTFENFSKDLPVPAVTMTSTTPAATPGAPSAPPASAPAASAAPAASSTATAAVDVAPDPALISAPIPDTLPEMLAALRARNDQIRALIDRGSFAAVYVPAFQAKDVALAIDARKDELPGDQQKIVAPAVSRLVRTAYLLDAFGDLGNKQQITEAYTRFADAVKDIESALSGLSGKQ